MIAFLAFLVSLISSLGLAGAGPAAAPAELEALHREAARADGRVVLTFAVRDNVLGNGHGVCIRNRGDGRTFFSGRYQHDDEMVHGPARLTLKLQDGRIRDASLAVGRNFPRIPEGAFDLGEVDGSTAAAFCLDLAETADPDPGETLILAAVVARGAEPQARLLEMVRSRSLHRESRGDIVMWLAMFAGERITAALQDLALDGDEDREVREHAVFALRMQDEEAALPLLLDIARHHRDPFLQRAAILALGDYDDSPEVFALLDEILTAP